MILSSSMGREGAGKNRECGMFMIDAKSICQSSDLFVMATASQEDKGSNATRMIK